MQYTDKNNRPIVTAVQVQSTLQGNGFGFPQGTSALDTHAENSVLGMWVLSKFLDKLLQFHFVKSYLLTIVSLPHFMFRCLNPLVFREKSRRAEPRVRPPRLSWLKARRRTKFVSYSTPDAGALLYNTWWIGRGTVRKSDPGSTWMISSTLPSQRSSIGCTRKNRPLDLEEDPGVVRLFASGAARRGGALSQMRLPRFLLLTTRGNPLLNIKPFELHFPHTWH